MTTYSFENFVVYKALSDKLSSVVLIAIPMKMEGLLFREKGIETQYQDSKILSNYTESESVLEPRK